MTTQIVITTILAMLQLISFGHFFKRIVNFEDNLWIEWAIILVLSLFEYLIWK